MIIEFFVYAFLSMLSFNRNEAVTVFSALAVVAVLFSVIRFGVDIPALFDGQGQQAAVITATEGGGQVAFGEAVRQGSNAFGRVDSLIIDDIKLGEGPAVEAGDEVSVHYIGRLEDGQEFDNSYEKGSAFTFRVGKGRVIDGWDQGLVGMRAGGQRVLVVPPDLAYGRDGFGPIPPEATLIFAIELVSIN